MKELVFNGKKNLDIIPGREDDIFLMEE